MGWAGLEPARRPGAPPGCLGHLTPCVGAATHREQSSPLYLLSYNPKSPGGNRTRETPAEPTHPTNGITDEPCSAKTHSRHVLKPRAQDRRNSSQMISLQGHRAHNVDSRGRIRTVDLGIMRPASCHCSTLLDARPSMIARHVNMSYARGLCQRDTRAATGSAPRSSTNRPT